MNLHDLKIETLTGHIFFAFTDSDFEEKFDTFEEMRKYAKENYKKEHHNVVHITAFVYNSFYNTNEPYDTLKVNKRNYKKIVPQFINECKKRILDDINNN